MKYITHLYRIIVFISINANLIIGTITEGKNRSSFEVVRIVKPIVLSGKLDDPQWINAKPIELNYEVIPGENTKAPQKTLVYALYDNDNIYFGFRCYDSTPNEIREKLSDRDQILDDDYVTVMLDTYGDYQKVILLSVNPLGIQGDYLQTIGSEDKSFDIVWETKASKDNSGWTAEMSIPFKNLSFPTQEIQNWLINVFRVYPRASKVTISWSPLDRNNPSLIDQAGKLTGLRDIYSSGSFELLPYVSSSKVGSLYDMNNSSSGFKHNPIEGRIGGSAKYYFGSSLSVEAVVNPDFSQVETDEAQINVNTTFALYYPEKRPFFLAGRELFEPRHFYTRTINDPAAAARVVGKTGALSYMYLGALDRNTIITVPGMDVSNTINTKMNSLVNIFKSRYDFGDENHFGAMLSTRNLTDAHNYVLGFDWSYKFFNNWYIYGFLDFSNTKELNKPDLFKNERNFISTKYNAAFNGENYSGDLFENDIDYRGRESYFNLCLMNWSPTFQIYNGIFNSTGFRMAHLTYKYTIYAKNSFIDQGGVMIYGALTNDYEGKPKDRVFEPGIFLTLKGQTNINLSYQLFNYENFLDIIFKDVRITTFSLDSKIFNEFSFGINGQIGDFIHRSSIPEVGSGYNISGNVNFKPSSKFNLSIGYSTAALSSKATNEDFYRGYILRTTAVFQFSSEAFIRGIFEYDSFSDSFYIYPLFNYKLNAFTTFYLGATNNYMNYGDGIGFRSNQYQFFLKFQYLLQI